MRQCCGVGRGVVGTAQGCSSSAWRGWLNELSQDTPSSVADMPWMIHVSDDDATPVQSLPSCCLAVPSLLWPHGAVVSPTASTTNYSCCIQLHACKLARICGGGGGCGGRTLRPPQLIPLLPTKFVVFWSCLVVVVVVMDIGDYGGVVKEDVCGVVCCSGGHGGRGADGNFRVDVVPGTGRW